MKLIEEIVIASRNQGKIEHYKHALQGVIDKVVGLNDLEVEEKPEESGESAEENSIIKAKFYSTKTDYPVFCEDESLFVDFLDKEHQPGTHVRRINGKDEVSDDELFSYWEKLIFDVPDDKRTGYWHFAYSLAYNGQIKTSTRDIKIKFFYPASKIRIPGWPMSSLQGSTGKPSAERTEVEKQESAKKDGEMIREIINELIKDN